MAIDFANRMSRNLTTKLAISALTLGFCLSAVPESAQQDQQNPPQQQQDQQPPQAQPQDQQPQNQPQAQPDQQQQGQQPPDQQQDQMNQQQDQGAPPPDEAPPPPDDRGPMPPPDRRRDVPPPPPPDNNYVVPDTLILPSAAVIRVRNTGWLSSDRNKPGDQVILTLAQPLVVNGLVVARRGQTVIGTVEYAEKAGRVKGVSKLGLQLGQLTLVDGQLIAVKTTLINATGGTTRGRDAAAIVGTTGIGAGIGAAAAGGPGAAIGAGAGFVASVAGVLLTRGRPTIIPPESLLTFRLETPITVSTAYGQTAFRPVTSADYAPKPRPRQMVRPYYPYPYPPPYAYYPYPYPYRYYP
jgi:hypothetical protein